MSGETIFMTTGKPSSADSRAASAAEVAIASLGCGIPYAAQSVAHSAGVSEVRPAAFTLSRTPHRCSIVIHRLLQHLKASRAKNEQYDFRRRAVNSTATRISSASHSGSRYQRY